MPFGTQVFLWIGFEISICVICNISGGVSYPNFPTKNKR